MRAIAILAGLAILAAATCVVVIDARLDPAHAALVAAMAAGTAVGAICVARVSWRVGVIVAVAVVAGESYGMLATGERVIRHREALEREVGANDPAAVAARDRSAAARAALLAHDRTAADALARRHCGRECRAGLELTRAQIVAERDAAQAALVAMPTSGHSPLADRLGIAAWTLDLLMAGLLSIGANGLACVLIYYGAHTPARAPAVAVVADPIERAANVVPMKRAATQRDAAQFAIESLRPAPGQELAIQAAIDRYWAWCDGRGLARPDVHVAFQHMMALCERANVETRLTDGRRVVARGLELAG